LLSWVAADGGKGEPLLLPRLADFTFMERSRDGQDWVSILD